MGLGNTLGLICTTDIRKPLWKDKHCGVWVSFVPAKPKPSGVNWAFTGLKSPVRDNWLLKGRKLWLAREDPFFFFFPSFPCFTSLLGGFFHIINSLLDAENTPKDLNGNIHNYQAQLGADCPMVGVGDG